MSANWFSVSKATLIDILTKLSVVFDTKADASHSHTKNDITDFPTLGTAAAKDVPSSGNATSSQVVMGNDTRLSDSRPASDVSAWAKAASKPTYTASEVGAIASTLKGANNGVAELDSNGKVPSSQLPSYVDDVIEGYYNSSTDRFYQESTFITVIPPESGKSWVDISSNKSYRWTGSVYTRVDEGVQLGETSSTAYRGDRGKIAYDHSQLTSGNPHNVTKSDVGLGNVGNFKAVSTGASQGLTDTEKSNARANIGAGTSNFSGSYNALSDIPSSFTPSSHTHGNIQNGGTLQTNDVAIANGDKLVITDSSDSSKIARASIAFDGSTATKCLTQKGTWENFTNNAGTVTSVKVGSTSYSPSSGVVSLPAYPTVNNGTLTIKRNGTSLGTFTADQSGNSDVNISVPTKVSELTNDSGFLLRDTGGGIGGCVGNGSYSYFKIATITIPSNYINGPIVFEVSQRQFAFSRLQISFASAANADPSLSYFFTDMDDHYYIKKTATSTWELYGEYNEKWGAFVLHRVTGYRRDSLSITYNFTNLSALPDDCIQVSYGGNVGYARTAGSAPASDVYAWAKASSKPSYTLDEVSDGSTRKLANYLAKAGDTMTGTLRLGSSNQSTMPTCGLYVHDIRNATVNVNSFSNAVNFLFDDSSLTNYTWQASMLVRGWNGSYNAWELAGPASDTDQRTLPLYVRTSKQTTWGSWRKIYDSSNPPTASEVGAAASSHTHGNIQNGGTLQTNDITIASGDKLVVTDSSDSSKIARASISFDGSTATKCLTQKGTWETFASTDTLNTVGATNNNNKLYLIGTLAQGPNPISYAQGGCYAQSGKLYSNSKVVINLSKSADTDSTEYNVYFGDTAGAGKYHSRLTYTPSVGSLCCTNSKSKRCWELFDYDIDGTALGSTRLILGNSLGPSDAGSRYGVIALYDDNGYPAAIRPNLLSASRDVYIPDKDGTMNVLTGAVADGNTTEWRMIFGGTDGETKTHSRLIYKPSSGNLYVNNSSGKRSWSVWDEGITTTSSTWVTLELGNSTASGTTGARRGRIYLNSDGSSGVTLTASSDGGLYINQYAAILTHDANNWRLQQMLPNGGGYVHCNTTNGAYGISWWASDTKLKENIDDTKVTALDKVDRIDFIQFDWKKNDTNKDADRHVSLGVSANQIEEFMPDAVWNIKQPEDYEYDIIKNIDTGKMATYALKAIQELHKVVKDQAAEIADLKSKLA